MAAAAYQSGDRLFCEYDQKTKHYRNKKEVVFSTILTVSVQLEKLYHERTDMAVRVFPFDRPRELVEMLWDYYDIRADERRSWSRYAQRECSLNALKKLSQAICWLQEQKLYTLESYETAFEPLKQEASEAANAIDAMKQERHSLETWHKHLINRKRYRPVYEKYAGKMFKANKEKYADEHREELDKYRAAVRYFKAHPERENTDASALVDKHRQLLLRQLYITEICLPKTPAAALSSVADATASPPSSALHLTFYPAHLIGTI